MVAHAGGSGTDDARGSELDPRLDPHMVLRAVRDQSGQVTDFLVMDVNPAACAYQRLAREQLVGSSILGRLGARGGPAMVEAYASVLRSGQPSSLAGAGHPHEAQASERRYDVEAVPDGDLLALTWRDATERHAATALATGDALFQTTLENAPIGMCLVSPTGEFLHVNAALCSMLGRTADELARLTWQELTHPDDVTADAAHVADVIAGRRREYRMLKRYVAADGHLIWGELSVSGVYGEDSSLRHFISQIVDITDRVAAERALADSESLMRAVLDGSSDVISRYGRDMRLDYVNHTAVELSGIPREQWIGSTMEEMGFAPADVAVWNARTHATFATGLPDVFQYELKYRGSVRSRERSLTPQFGPDGSVTHVVATDRDITEHVLAERELQRLATHDSLTNLANRAAILDEIARSQRAGHRSGRFTAVLLIDLDHFKDINDSLGHGAGDELLRSAAARLQEWVRGGDVVGRLGGDEFVVVMRDIDSLATAVEASLRLVGAFRAPFSVSGGELYATASVGISIATESSAPDDLIREADTAMYAAKAAGRDGVSVFDEVLRSAVTSRHAIANDLRRALERGELEVRYQPEIDLTTGSMIAVEALLRWNHPDGEQYSAGRFIEIAEETGLILDIGEWVLGEVCTRAAGWALLRPDHPLTVRFNISALQLAEAGLLTTLDAALESGRLDPARLCIEITETALLRETAAVRRNIAGIHERGISLALDDFGTGYASLAYLRDYPIDVLKIDRSFITHMTSNEHDLRLVTAIISFASVVGMTVTAEGVENEPQAALLQSLGCPGAQGYLFSRAVPPDEISALLDHRFR